ncbi:SDR family oxidoreductase [Streptomyces tricolor]|uniref:SDR family oxidoreductase n=1 Tax=Streptomyces tricolor TaxID=68277 RepID=UPI0036E63A3C
MILVTGATGSVGGEVVEALARAGEPGRALVRRPVEPSAWQADKVEQAVGDLNEPRSLTPALDDVRGVFLLPGYRDMPGLLDRMRRAGVERVVLLSSLATVATDTRNVLSEYMIGSETAVRESGLAWTFLRPNAFMSNALRWLPQLRAGDVVRDSSRSGVYSLSNAFGMAAAAFPGSPGCVPSLSGRPFATQNARLGNPGRAPASPARGLIGTTTCCSSPLKPPCQRNLRPWRDGRPAQSWVSPPSTASSMPVVYVASKARNAAALANSSTVP